MTGPRIVVVGGGIAGLAAAHRLVELARERETPLQLTLLEAADRLGGSIWTERTGGFLIEHGPDSFISEKPWALRLAHRIGLGERLRRTDDRYRRTYVVHRGRLHPLPEGFLLLAPGRLWPFALSPLFSWRGKLRMALDLLLPRRPADGDESLGSFVARRLGREALDRVAEPLVAGIYTADPARLSLAATMPRFLALEREHRSLILGLRKSAGAREVAGASGARWSLFVTLADGMSELVDALAARLPAAGVRLGCPATALVRDGGDARWRVGLGDGTSLPADGVILSGEAHRAAALARVVDPELASLLEAIPYASAVVVSFAFPRPAIAHPLDGFGFVVPRSERRAALACTFSSVKYPGRAPDGFVLLRVFLGGAARGDVLDRDDADLRRLALTDITEVLGIAGTPVLTRVTRHPRAMPQYEVGHLERVAALEARVARLPGLAVTGSAYRGVGISDCVRAAEESAEQLLDALAGPPAAAGRRLDSVPPRP